MHYSLSECARQLGMDRRAIAGLVAALNIPLGRHPSSGRAKAIDEAGFKKLQAAVKRALSIA